MANAVRQIIAAAASALQEDDDDDFTQVVSQTRRSFRRNLRSQKRGRKSSALFKRKTLLLRRANSDYCPIKAECDMLTSCGLGYSDVDSRFELHWNRTELDKYICDLYPKAPLELVGFKLAKMDRHKQLINMDVDSVEELKEAVGQSQIVIIPSRDLPLHRQTGDNDRIEPRTSRIDLIHENPTSNEIPTIRRPSRSMLTLRPQSNEETQPRMNETQALNLEVANTTLHCNDEIIFSQDFGLNDDNINVSVENFVIPSLPSDVESKSIDINRSNCTSDLFNFYLDETVVFKNLSVTFLGEIGIDGGGLTKEMFNLFFGTIENTFFRGEDCIVPFLPLNRMRKDKEKFILIGRAIEHMLLLTGNVPAKISRVSLSLIGHPDKIIDVNILLEDFYLFVNACERCVLKKAVNNFSDLNSKEKEILINIFHSNHFFELPSEVEIKEQVISIATDILCDKSKQFVDLIRQGISLEKYGSFWRECDFTVLLDMQKPTPDKIVNCLQTQSDLTNEQTTVLHFLEMYIRCMDNDTLRQFVFFVTGSFQMPDMITIYFNNFVGLSRRPIISTCSNLIELSTNYCSYQDLKKEINSCLFSEEAYIYSTY